MRRLLAIVAVSVLALVAVGAASADVDRYQMRAGTLTVTLPAYGYVHLYGITMNPCDGSFTGVSLPGNVFGIHETITGTLFGSALSFHAVYESGYMWMYDGPMAGGIAHDSGGGSFAVTATAAGWADVTQWKNHGQYVSQAADKRAAAHSCIGMPKP